jgi:hypothetical protein
VLHRGDDRIQAYFTKNRPFFGSGRSFGQAFRFLDSPTVLALMFILPQYPGHEAWHFQISVRPFATGMV